MNKLHKIAIGVVISILVLFTLIETFYVSVPNGHVGVRVSKIDGEVNKIPLSVGWHMIGFGTSVKDYPTFTQTYTWTHDKTEGSPTDESMNFQVGSGVTINADISLSYMIDSSKAHLLYQKYKRDYREITEQVMRNAIRNGLNKHGSEYTAEGLLAGEKTKLAADVMKDINNNFHDVGIIVEQFGFVNELRLPSAIQIAINSKIQTTQEAMQKEAELRKTNAVNAITLANAQASADAVIKKATAEATALQLVAKAIRENGKEAADLRIQTEWIAKWNGAVPTTQLGDSKGVQVHLDAPKK